MRIAGARALALPLVAATLMAATSWAQYPGGGTPGRGGMDGSSIRRPAGNRESPNADTPASLAGQVQMQLGRLEEDLRISAAQQAAWDAYANKVIRFADDVARARFAARSAPDPNSTVPQQLDRLADAARNRLAAVEEIAEAGKALYGVLAPDQKSTADRRLAAITQPLVAGGALAARR